MKMTTIARKVLQQQVHDNLTLDRLIDRFSYQIHYPVQLDQNYEKEETAYIFEDGSALINSSLYDWRVDTQYGKNCDHEIY